MTGPEEGGDKQSSKNKQLEHALYGDDMQFKKTESEGLGETISPTKMGLKKN